MLGPILAAGASPLLAWRDPIYIIAGFAGILGLAGLLLQPLLAGGYLPGLAGPWGRRWHRALGLAIVGCVLAHVGGLWITSPPDVIDVLLFRSPTPFAIWGVAAMWALFASAGLAGQRRRLNPRLWRSAHLLLSVVVVLGTVVHAVQIDGTMETVSKGLLCILVILATAKTLWDQTRGRP